MGRLASSSKLAGPVVAAVGVGRTGVWPQGAPNSVLRVLAFVPKAAEASKGCRQEGVWADLQTNLAAVWEPQGPCVQGGAVRAGTVSSGAGNGLGVVSTERADLEGPLLEDGAGGKQSAPGSTAGSTAQGQLLHSSHAQP